MSSLKKSIYLLLFAFAFPIAVFGQDVTVSLGHVEVDGYTNDIVVPVTLTNPDSTVGGIQFDVISVPAMVEMSGTTPAGETSSFSSDYTVFSDGSARVVFYNGSGPDGIPAGGDGVVLNLHFDGTDVLSAVLGLNIYNLIVSNENGNILSSSGENGSMTIGDVIYLSATSDTGDVEDTVSINIELENSDIVGGMQFDFYDTPNYLDIVDLTAMGRAEGFTADFSVLENGNTRVVMFDQNNSNISAGTGAVLEVDLVIHTNAYADQVGINFENVTVTDDIGGFYWIASTDSGTVTVYPGYIEEPHNLTAEDGMDAQVLLTWDPPIGPIFSRPVTIIIETDSWGYETTWQITDNETGEIVEAYTDGALENETEYTWDIELLFGSYTFTIFDSYGDGIYSPGGYAIFIEDEEVYSNIGIGWSGSEESVVFDVTAGRFIVTNRSFEQPLPDKSMVNAETISAMNMILGEPTFVTSGSFTPWEIDEVENTRPVEIDEYKIYRSMDNVNFENIDIVDGQTTSYLDENVVNSTTYYYYVTAVYPSGSESDPTNTVTATPVEWVELWMDNGASLSGQMDTLDFYVNNETSLGLFYFEIMDYPDVLNSIAILPTERTEDWSLEVVDIANGNMAITGIAFSTALASGSGAVCRAVLYPVAEEEITVNLSYAGASVQDENFIELNWTTESAIYEVGIETQYLVLTGGYGISGEEFTSSIIMQNTQPVYGIQVDILANPPFLTGTNYYFNPLLDLTDWTLTGDMVGNIYRLIAYDNTLSNPLNPGTAHIAEITYDVVTGAPDSSIVDISVDDAVVSDINGLPMHVEGIPSTVYIGQPPVVYSIENVSDGLTPGGMGSFEIHMLNTEIVNIVELSMVDMPNYLTVTNVTGLDRFSSGIIDGSSGETEEGLLYVLGFDFTTGIISGEGAILQVDVQFAENIQNPSVIMMLASVSAGDVNAGPILSVNSGFGQFFLSGLSAGDEEPIPAEFSLYPNYPNPFNPSTIITYDLAGEANVRLQVYDLMGRMIKNIINEMQPAGHHLAVWNATDNFGNPVSAGVYIYRLQADDHVFNRKMILIK